MSRDVFPHASIGAIRAFVNAAFPMSWDEWEPIYQAIRADFGYDQAADEHGRDRFLAHDGDWAAIEQFPDFTGKAVAIVGGSTLNDEDHTVIHSADTVVAAGEIVEEMNNNGILPDMLVTDLDTTSAIPRDLSCAGVPVAIHAHGDNISQLDAVLPLVTPEWVLPTTQVKPVGPVVNTGGFTDGDRAAFLADALGAETLVFPGWDFDDASVTPTKQRKLQWAERLVFWLEHYRGDRFTVLDGRRAAIEPIDGENDEYLQ